VVTYFVVQSFQQGDKGFLIPDEPREARGPGQAQLWAEKLAANCAGAVAFARTGDPATGAWEDAVIIATFGLVPEAAVEMVS
jgi:hypothetical protein